MSDAGLTQWLSNLADRTPAPAAERLLVPWQLKQRRCAMVARYSSVLALAALIERLDRDQAKLMQLAADDQTAFRSAQRSLAPHKERSRSPRNSIAARSSSLSATHDRIRGHADLAQTFSRSRQLHQ